MNDALILVLGLFAALLVLATNPVRGPEPAPLQPRVVQQQARYCASDVGMFAPCVASKDEWSI